MMGRTLREAHEPARLRYERARAPAGGPPVVLLSGLFAGGWLWDATWRRLVKRGVDAIRLLALVLSGAPGLEEGDIGLGPPRAVTREYVEALAERLFHDRSRIKPAMVERTYALLSERRHLVTALRALKAARAYDARAALARVTCPLLMVWGAEDRATPPHAWERAARELPRCEFRTLPDCGHSPMLERPDAFTDLLLAFLRREAPHAESAGT